MPADVPPIEPPADDTVPARMRPVVSGRPTLSRRLVTAYFAGGLALLLAGTIAVIYLTVDAYDRAEQVTVSVSRSPKPAGDPVSTAVPSPAEPSGPLLERIGPQRLANGEKFVVEGERGAKFEITVRARKFRKTGCDSYAKKPEHGGYLPTQLQVKVLSGEPDVSDYAFRFQQADGTRFNSVYGSSCEKDYGAFVRRLVAGRTYRTTVVFDVPNASGDIIFVYPTIDVLATWHLG
ncbi:hypothetical protein [Actinoplanes sp. ATCC 53533]|uniref:hypothetical protein n=1 Tax=Actinoplanes sp. ATCC 53533 TaxID=1288362 RepID=UPI000F769A18|nr:hypothetical protein [Actinoplanes sp. ATCC 53533]